jgi:hypothetical protein
MSFKKHPVQQAHRMNRGRKICVIQQVGRGAGILEKSVELFIQIQRSNDRPPQVEATSQEKLALSENPTEGPF